MALRWLKPFLPRGLYGRALLILVVPIAVLQLVVSVVFIQRHYDRVTAQMTRSVAIPLDYLAAEIDAAPERRAAEAVAARLGPRLGFALAFNAEPVTDARALFDFSGRALVRTLREIAPQVGAIDLVGEDGVVRLELSGRWGDMLVSFPRARVSASNPHQLLVLMAVTGLLMTGIAYLFLRNQLRPITLLAAAADAYGRGHVVPYRPRGATEVRAAGSAFLDMRARIEQAREQRTLLLSGVSHDLRTPLTRLKLGLAMAGEGEDLAEMQRDVAEMERMIDDFLALARGDALSGAEPCAPAEIARRIAANAARMGREIETRIYDGADQPVPLRRRAVERAVENLVQNALRYGQHARLCVVAEPGCIRFIVEDDGPGIPPERRAEALRPFTRLDRSRNQDRGGGAGLGLAIAMDVARGHGGTLTLDRSADLGGLRAEIELPR